LWSEVQTNWEGFALESASLIETLLRNSGEEAAAEEVILDYSGEERLVTGKARVRQDFFRNAVLSAHNFRCCITGLAVPELLIASHIVPWSKDSANRLNPSNGLALSMLHDKAFDLGMITINADMTVRLSKKITDLKGDFCTVALKKFDGKLLSMPEKFLPDVNFLKYHRDNVFEKWIRPNEY